MRMKFVGLGLAFAVLATPLAAQDVPKGSWDELI
jgi:hypothetical protein